MVDTLVLLRTQVECKSQERGQFEDDDNSDSEEDNVPTVVGVPLSSRSITIVPVTLLPLREVTAPSCNLDVLDSAPQDLLLKKMVC